MTTDCESPPALPAPAASGWHGELSLRYQRDAAGTGAHDRHSGPLRVLKRLYPEGPAICHHVLVHPPGGVVGGDRLDIDVELGSGSHALITTPGATRFYRSDGALAQQSVSLRLGADARLEWLPLETIAHAGCQAENRLRLALAPGAEMMGWDVLALGLPAAGAGFERGSYLQHIEWPGVWQERARIDGADTRLLDSPLGWAGHRVLGTLWFGAGTALGSARRDALLDGAREALMLDADAWPAGASSPHDGLVLVRVLGARTEGVLQRLERVRAAWRQLAWGLPANRPRVWST
ncbi:MAG: urease accessory protein UreD [Rubrivivax sp.]|nr:urease accessory protein UreD [Rubrivivax sp.]